MKNVYLIPINDGEYVSRISETQPDPRAIFLMEEPSYPATLFNRRMDANWDSVWNRCDVANQEELLSYLDCLGKCGWHLNSVYYNCDSQQSTVYYDYSNNTNPKLDCLYDMCYAKACDRANSMIDEEYED